MSPQKTKSAMTTNQEHVHEHRTISTTNFHTDEGESRSFNVTAIVMGLFCGLLIQMSTFCLNVFLARWSTIEGMEGSKYRIIIFSACWSIGASILALIFLTTLRARVTAILCILFPQQRSQANKDTVDEMVISLECTFVVGTLLGAWFGWITIDFAMGFQAESLYSFLILLLCLLWLRCMVRCLSKEVNENPLEEHEIEERFLETQKLNNFSGDGLIMIV